MIEVGTCAQRPLSGIVGDAKATAIGQNRKEPGVRYPKGARSQKCNGRDAIKPIRRSKARVDVNWNLKAEGSWRLCSCRLSHPRMDGDCLGGWGHGAEPFNAHGRMWFLVENSNRANCDQRPFTKRRYQEKRDQ
jgi:hypothetical protein